MANTQIVPKLSTVAGKIPTADQLSPGAISINHTDRKIYAKHPNGTVYKLAGAKDAPDRVWAFDLSSDGTTTYLGYLLYSDFPSTGSVYDSPNWEISRTIFNAAGTTSTESSATGQWSNRTSLTYS
jgi:hypothetical protein